MSPMLGTAAVGRCHERVKVLHGCLVQMSVQSYVIRAWPAVARRCSLGSQTPSRGAQDRAITPPRGHPPAADVHACRGIGRPDTVAGTVGSGAPRARATGPPATVRPT